MRVRRSWVQILVSTKDFFLVKYLSQCICTIILRLTFYMKSVLKSTSIIILRLTFWWVASIVSCVKMADVPQIKIRSFFKTKLLQRLGASLNSQDVTIAGEGPPRLKKTNHIWAVKKPNRSQRTSACEASSTTCRRQSPEKFIKASGGRAQIRISEKPLCCKASGAFSL